MNVAIAFSGKIGSGKSSLAREVGKALAWDVVSFGDYVREEATLRGIHHERENLQNLGEKLLCDDANAFCRSVLDQIEWKNKSFIIDGIRHNSVYHILKDLILPCPLYLIHLELKETERIVRLEQRQNSISLKELYQMDNHSTEIDVISSLPHQASLVLDASLPINELTNLVVKWVR